MYKAVKSKGRVVEMARQDEKTLLYWVAGNVKNEGYKIKQTADIFCQQQERIWRIWKKKWKNSFLILYGRKEIRYRI